MTPKPLKYTLLTLLLSFYNIGLVRSQDYSQYHLGIIKAEEQAFVKENIKSGIKTYLNTFRQFDFVFVQDCMTAMQIALYANDERSFLAFANKATLNGWMPQRMDTGMMAYVLKHPIYIKYKDSVAALYNANRPRYLHRIDTAALCRMYYLFSFDQLEKNIRKNESRQKYSERYGPQIKNTFNALQQLIAEKGWPADKLLGLDQAGVMRELRSNCPEPQDIYEKHKDDDPNTIAGISQFQPDEYLLSSTMVFPVIIHYGDNRTGSSPYNKGLRYVTYPDSFYLRQIRAGNMHPKELAFLYDFAFSGPADSIVINTATGEKYFHIGLRTGEYPNEKPKFITEEQIDAFRAQYFIAPLQHDWAKVRFIVKNGMYIGSGFLRSRS